MTKPTIEDMVDYINKNDWGFGWEMMEHIRNQLQLMQWRDIESAPKDGTEFVARSDYSEDLMLVRFNGREFEASWDGCKVIEYQDDCGTDYKDVPPLNYWMPLPPPPRKETQ